MDDREKTQPNLDTSVKKITRPSNTSNNQQQTPDQSPGSDAKKESHDESHSFRYRFEYKQYRVTCHTHGTVLDALRTSPEFENMTKKKQGMEIVIQREKERRAAVSTHFPCHLIDNDELVTVSFIKVPNGSSPDTQSLYKQSNPRKKIQPDKLMTFCVETQGGQNIKTKVMKNPELRKKVKYVCVYGYKGEKVKQALRRDGRFDKTILKTRCVLSEPETRVDTEMSQPVDGLDGKSHQGREGEMLVVKVKRIGRVSQPQPDSLEDWDNTPTEELSVPPGGTSEAALSPQNPTTTDTVQTQLQSKEAGKDGSSLVVKQKRQEIPNSKEILNILPSQYAGLEDHLKERENLKKPSDVQQFLRVEFGKKTQGFQEVKKVKILMELSASVCQVRIEGTAKGTGFLLFDKFILTNAHVVQEIYEPITNTLQQSVKVTFDFEDLGEKTQQIPVQSEVVAYGKDDSGNVDFALLELSSDPDITLPLSLLDTFSFPSPDGGIFIIGHPEGGVKKTDPCFIIQRGDFEQAVEKHLTENKEFLHVIKRRCLEEKWDITHLPRDTKKIIYDSCLFHGAFGSPVFNEYCQLIAMHTGGYSYPGEGQKTQSIKEYAIPLSGILEEIIIQEVRRKRVDVLQGFLSHRSQKLDVVMERVKTQSDKASLVKAFQEKLPFDSNTSATDQGEQRTFHQFLFDKDDATGVDATGVDATGVDATGVDVTGVDAMEVDDIYDN
ncbi:serine protease FAM111A-like isoform X1 [Salvelinus namaycush]|uniref:Serine protease FAM111A-like isoform X1 n=1 Tax=Salvelinus namaycush TaxID=8040 RepID=A0A8U1BTF3_SALNM|nr:serine protease FAM111A-like isoform X1 [Salvelinus namaycush]XP_038860351.1 serine protease FAM111A-like isoform X1 [Salvelinus namaycush]XP_038860352.1 serine protease FAM111A-like isoform X1 [Salvelinus namaycush]